MKKLFAAVLIMAISVSSVVFAGYSDEYKAKHPGHVHTKTEQDLSGKVVTTTTYNIFWNKNFSLHVRKSNDYKYAYIQYAYMNKQWMFYDGFTWGDGNKIHDLKLFIDPIRKVDGTMVYERIMASVDPIELKNATIIHAHSQHGDYQVMINLSDPKWTEWKAALEDADKILNDK